MIATTMPSQPGELDAAAIQSGPVRTTRRKGQSRSRCHTTHMPVVTENAAVVQEDEVVAECCSSQPLPGVASRRVGEAPDGAINPPARGARRARTGRPRRASNESTDTFGTEKGMADQIVAACQDSVDDIVHGEATQTSQTTLHSIDLRNLRGVKEEKLMWRMEVVYADVPAEELQVADASAKSDISRSDISSMVDDLGEHSEDEDDLVVESVKAKRSHRRQAHPRGRGREVHQEEVAPGRDLSTTLSTGSEAMVAPFSTGSEGLARERDPSPTSTTSDGDVERTKTSTPTLAPTKSRRPQRQPTTGSTPRRARRRQRSSPTAKGVSSEGSFPRKARQDSNVSSGVDSQVLQRQGSNDSMASEEPGQTTTSTHSLGTVETRQSRVKPCGQCGSDFKGFGQTCGTCRKIGKRGSVQQCQVCQVFFTGYDTLCDLCQGTTAKQSIVAG